MSTVKKVTLALLGFVVSLAAGASALFRYRAASADKKIRGSEIADAAGAAKQQARLADLAMLKRRMEALPGKSVVRTQAEVDAELRRKGLLK